MIFRYKIIFLFCVYLIVPNIATATSMDKLKITSDNLTIQKDESTATFTGTVTVIFDNLKLTTSKLTVLYSDVGGSKEIKEIIIPAKLKAIRDCGAEVITADKGNFNNSTKKLTLEGNVHMQKKGNVLITNKLIYSSSL